MTRTEFCAEARKLLKELLDQIKKLPTSESEQRDELKARAKAIEKAINDYCEDKRVKPKP